MIRADNPLRNFHFQLDPFICLRRQVICVSILGMLFFNRMQYYEKKHFI